MKNDNNKKAFVLIIVSALIMLIMVGSLTYAYFTANVTANNTLNITATVSNTFDPIFTSYPEGTLDLMVTTSSMLNTGAGSSNTTVADTASQKLYVTLLADNATCTYSLAWKDTGTTAYVPSANATSAGLKEYTLKVVNSAGTVVVNETSINSIQNNVDANNQAIIASGLSITSNNTLVTETLTVTATIYNLNVAQTIYNKNYKSTVGVTSVVCA